MAKDPLKKPLNRAEQLKTDPQYQKGIKLYDIDLAISKYMENVVIPTIEVKEEKIKVPVMYGNPERWKSVKKDGVLRDKDGQLILPLVMFKRNSFERDDAMSSMMNRHVTYPATGKYSSKHKYDKFSLMTQTKKPLEYYNVTMPDYVTVSYEVIVWTDFIEHMNKIVEAYQFATDEYWGDRDGFKFRVKIDSFDNTVEVGEGTERSVRTTFTMLVNAYLLPDKFDNEPTTTKSIGIKKIIWGTETII